MANYFKFETDKPALSYKCGEEMKFKISARRSCLDIDCKYIKWVIKTDDGQIKKGFGSCEAGKPLILTASISRPGFVYVTCTAYNSENAPDQNFDVLEASAAAQIEDLEYCDTLPEDFDDYWAEIKEMVDRFDCKAIYWKELTHGIKKGFKAYDVRISTPSGRPASGYITIPDKEGKFPIRISFQGYCIVGSFIEYTDNAITGMFNAHGIENNLSKIELNNKYESELGGYGFRDKENESNMTTYWRGMFIRNLIAAKFLKSLHCWDKKTFISSGGSQGAFQAVGVAAHDKDVTFLDISVPGFCNLNAKNKGYVEGWAPNYKQGVRYFDTIANAMRVKCPVHILAKLGDTVCRASTIATLYNCFNVPKSLDFVQSGTHSYDPPEREIYHLRFNEENPFGEVKKGKYRHFKGNEYEVIDTCFDSETREEMVIYKALYGKGDIWVRPKYMFLESIYKNGEYIKRFRYIGE